VYPEKHNIIRIFIFLGLLFSCSTGRRNNSTVLSSSVIPDTILYYQLENEKDLHVLINAIGNAKVVLLGESTHGTHEYYTWRTAITKKLIQEKGFDFMAIEGDWTDAYKINGFIKERLHDSSEVVEALKLFDRWPTSMWGNYEMVDLLQWINGYNQFRTAADKISFYGLDLYSFWEWTQYYMNVPDTSLQNLIRKTMDFFAVYNDDALKYSAALRQLKPDGSEIAYQLFNKILKLSNGKQPSDEARFVLYQDAWLILNGERYFRTMLNDRVKAINIRDQHMAETIKRLLKFHEPGAKAVVWVHNGHAGDIRYSSSSAGGYTSVAEILRLHYGRDKIFSVGFGTYKGTVMAGRTWNAALQEQTVLPAKEGSWEYLLHKQNNANKLILSKELRNNPALNKWIEFRSIGAAYDGTAIYNRSIIPERFDAFLFIDSTRTLRPVGIKTK
jgi:erythromycin esterase